MRGGQGHRQDPAPALQDPAGGGGSGFNSPTDFIVYVLRDLMGEADATEAADGTLDQRHEYTQDELDDVKRKLKNLGYL
ncbi:MAG: CopG family transcriptional regulator [Planctomycetota bacterium]